MMNRYEVAVPDAKRIGAKFLLKTREEHEQDYW